MNSSGSQSYCDKAKANKRPEMIVCKEGFEVLLAGSSDDADKNGREDRDSETSETSSSDAEQEKQLLGVNKTEKHLKNNNNDDFHIYMSLDVKDQDRHESDETTASALKKEACEDYFNHFDGTGKNRRVRCNLCPGRNVLKFSHIFRHIKNVHANRVTCRVCHKDIASISRRGHEKTCKRKAAWKNKWRKYLSVQ